MASAAVVINEFYSEGRYDWVELYADTDETTTGWTLHDSSISNNLIATIEEDMTADQYLVIGVGNRLDYDGDTITLKDLTKAEIDFVGYGDGHGAPKVIEQWQSVGRDVDSTDTNDDAADFTLFESQTPGYPNDNVAPVLNDITFSPTPVNDGQQITIQLDITDDSKITYIDLDIDSPRNYFDDVNEDEFTYDETNDVYEIVWTIPKYADGGTWQATYLYLSDEFGNGKNIQISDDEYTFTVINVNGEDNEAPVVTSATFSASSANYNEELTLTLEVNDDKSSVDPFYLEALMSTKTAGERDRNLYNFEETTDGKYTKTFKVHTETPDVIYKIVKIRVQDMLGNEKYYYFFNPEFIANPSANYGVDVTTADTGKSTNVNGTVTYTVTVTNTGDVTDTFDLTSTSATGYSTTLTVAGTVVTEVTLEPEDSEDITLTVKGLAAGDQTATFTATSQTNTATKDSLSIKTTVTQISNDLVVTLARIIGSSDEEAKTITSTFTIDSGNSGVHSVYFDVTDLKIDWANHADATISSDDIKFYEGTREITSASLLTLSAKTVTMKIDIPDEESIDYFGLYKGTINVKDSAGVIKQTKTVEFELKPRDFDAMGKKLDVDNWDIPDEIVYRNSEVTVTLDVENKYTEDAENVVVYLRNPELEIDEKSSSFDLDEDDTKELSFTFEIPKDADSGTYNLYVFVEGEDSTDSAKKLFNYELSSDKLDVNVESHHLMVNIDVADTTVNAGETLSASVSVFNAGTNKEKSLSLRVYNTALGYEKLERFDDITEGKTKTLTLLIPIPKNANDGVYTLRAELNYENDDRQDEDEIEKDLIDDIFITVGAGGGSQDNNNNGGSSGEILLTGTTTATGDAGESVKYMLNLKNSNTQVSEFEVKISGYTNWADEGKVEPSSVFNLGPGSSIPVFIYFTPKDDIVGTQTAIATVYVDGQATSTQTLTATISGGSGDEGGDLDRGVVTGSATYDIDMSTAIIIVAIIAAIVLLGGVYMFTIGRR